MFFPAKDIDSGELCPGKSVLLYNHVLCIFCAGAESSGSCGQAGFQEVLSFCCVVAPPTGKNTETTTIDRAVCPFINLSV